MIRGSVFAAALLCAAPIFASMAARAETLAMTAHLFGSGNVPATKSDGFAEGQFSFDTASRKLDYFVNYDGVAPVKIDLHGPAAMDGVGPALLSLPIADSPVSGQITLTPEQAAMLLSGKIYIDIHSKAFADGEIRGQIQKQ